jgi:hypothetical protein
MGALSASFSEASSGLQRISDALVSPFGFPYLRIRLDSSRMRAFILFGSAEVTLVSTASIAPFDDRPGQWLHTTASDGWLAPHNQRRYHDWGGCDVLAITDHDMHTPEPDGDEDLVILGGTELSLISPKTDGSMPRLGRASST